MKTLRLAAILIAILLCSCIIEQKTTTATSTASTQPALTDEQRQKNLESFDIVWTTINEKHFDPAHLKEVKWDEARDELRPKVQDAKSMDEARAAMHDLINRLKQTHFGVIPRSAYALMSKGSKANGVSGIDVRVL